MKLTTSTSSALLMFGVLIGLSAPVRAYQISLRFLVDNPVMFPVSEFVTGDLSNAADIAFEDLDPFFQMLVTGDGADSLLLLVRFETGGGDVIFTSTSQMFPVSVLANRWLTNFDLARIPDVRLGAGEEVNSRRLLPYIDGGLLSEGLYLLTVMLAATDRWDEAMFANYGLQSLSIFARTETQITLINPIDNSTVSSNPTLAMRC